MSSLTRISIHLREINIVRQVLEAFYAIFAFCQDFTFIIMNFGEEN